MYFQAHGICQQKQPVAVSSGSVIPHPSRLSFLADGTYVNSDTITITSSSTWTRSLIDTGDGTNWVVSAVPISGSSGSTCIVTVTSGYTGSGRQCTLRFTAGTASADVTIEQLASI